MTNQKSPRQRGLFSALPTAVITLLLTACQVDNNASNVSAVNICSDKSEGVNWTALLSENCLQLNQYRLFTTPQNPRDNPQTPGIGYQLNSALFTDFANKYRYVFIPPGEHAAYQQQEVFNLPIGSVLVKVFALPQSASSDAIMEIRLLIHRTRGWTGLVYRWLENEQRAVLDLNGENITTQVWHDDYFSELNYTIPTAGSCKTCHQFNVNNSSFMTPIGPKARLLNRTIQTSDGTINQLQWWQQLGLLNGLPADSSTIEFAPDWHDTGYTLQSRAKAYLDINCSHCHRDEGAAALSGLRLEYWRELTYQHGVCNPAHGWRGGGYDIWPGNGDISSLPLRMELSAATDRMPPLGRSLTDQSAVNLMRTWINSLPAQNCVE